MRYTEFYGDGDSKGHVPIENIYQTSWISFEKAKTKGGWSWWDWSLERCDN